MEGNEVDQVGAGGVVCTCSASTYKVLLLEVLKEAGRGLCTCSASTVRPALAKRQFAMVLGLVPVLWKKEMAEIMCFFGTAL